MALVIIGSEGPIKKDELEKQVSNLNLEGRVFLMGGIAEGSKYLRAFNVYAISSLKEGLPYSAIEAMAAELPIVSTPSGGLKDIFFGGESPGALSFTPGDSYELAQKIKILLKEKELASRLTLSSKQNLIKNFSLKSMLAKTRWVWEF